MRRVASSIAVAVVVLVTATVPAVAKGAAHQGMTKAQLKGRLLTARDFPAGWALRRQPTTGGGKVMHTGCLASAQLKTTRHGVNVTVSFVRTGGLPVVSESLGTARHLKREWHQVTHAFGGCRSITLTTKGTKHTISVAPLPFPRVAKKTAAYVLTFTVRGIRAGADIVLFDLGTFAGVLTYVDLGSPPISTVEAMMRKAVARARGHHVSRSRRSGPPTSTQ